MRVTLKDIAVEAGVSPMTVSNVVNGKRARVSQATIDRILRIVEERGYVPSASARSLAARSSRIIGLLVPAAGEDSLTISPHTVEIIGVLERELRKHDHHLMLRGIDRIEEVAEALRSWNLDGAVLLGFQDVEIDRLGPEAVGRVALVAMDSYSQNPLAMGVRSDDFTGAELAAKRLLELGHRRIAFAGPPFAATGVVRRRHDGFRNAFAEAGAPWEDAMVAAVETTRDDGRAFGRRLAAEHPDVTAVFATADILAIGVMEGLAEAGLAVPDDVSVVGYDDLDIATFVTPKLTTVAQDIPAKASVAVRLLLGQITREEHPDAAITLGAKLIERGTTAGPRSV